jgi:hypothetical protein
MTHERVWCHDCRAAFDVPAAALDLDDPRCPQCTGPFIEVLDEEDVATTATTATATTTATYVLDNDGRLSRGGDVQTTTTGAETMPDLVSNDGDSESDGGGGGGGGSTGAGGGGNASNPPNTNTIAAADMLHGQLEGLFGAPPGAPADPGAAADVMRATRQILEHLSMGRARYHYQYLRIHHVILQSKHGSTDDSPYVPCKPIL